MQVGGKKKKLCVEDSRMEKVIYSSSMGDITFTFSMLPKPLDIPIINDNINNIPNQGNLQSKKKHVRYHFSELIDISLLKQLFDTFYKLTGIKYAIHDEDNNVLTRNGTADICYKFHRFCPRTKQRCEQSDRYLSEIFQDNSNYLQDNIYVSYKCLNGLMEYATPIVVEGQHLGTIFMGQVLNEPPDEDFFRRQAREFGFNEAAYLEALNKVNIVSEFKVKQIMEFFSRLGQVLANIGLKRLHELEKAEEKFHKVFQCCPEPMAITKEDRYIDVNDAWIKSTGYQIDEAIGHTSHELGIWFDLSERNRFLDYIYKQGNIRNYECKMRMKSGNIRNHIVSAELMYINSIPHIIYVHQDITERKKAEEALRLSEERFAKAFNSNPLGMAITNQDGNFVAVNPSFCRILGYSQTEIMNNLSFERDFWWDESVYRHIKDMIFNNLQVNNIEIYFRIKSGEQRLGLFSAEEIDISGQYCMLSIIMDITQRRQIEKEMIRLDRLNLVGETAASLGHEIRNPITAVRGFLQIFKDKHIEEKMFLDLMIEELDRANDIITGFLSLTNNRLIELKLTNLNLIITNIFPLLHASAIAENKSILLDTQDTPDILVDEREIRQLILNLVRNGLESMVTGSVTIRTYVEDKKVVLSIQDQGRGINPEIFDKIGTPFLTTKEQGTGLGLAVCYGIAKRHNAKIDIKTDSNGTTFFISFPLNTPDIK